MTGYQAAIWNGVLAPAGTPRVIIERINREITTAMKSKDTIERYAVLGGDPLTSTPEEFARHIRAEIEKWAKSPRPPAYKSIWRADCPPPPIFKKL